MPHAVEQRSIALSMNFLMLKVDPTWFDSTDI